MLEKQGLETLSLREAARRAGVSHGAPYRHFENRESLLGALATQGFEMLEQAMAQAAKEGARARGEAYVHFALAHPQRFRLMFAGGLRSADHPELRARAHGAYEGLVRAFAAAGAAEAEVAAAAAWSLAHGLASLLLGGQFTEGRGAAGARSGEFVRAVLGAVRITGGRAQSSA